jgi:hypothetical protein
VDHRTERSQMSLPDALMSGLAVFELKYPLLLKFDEAYQNEAVVRHNLRTLLRVERAPCDTQLRTTLASVRHWTQSPVHSLSNPDIKDSSVPKTPVFDTPR